MYLTALQGPVGVTKGQPPQCSCCPFPVGGVGHSACCYRALKRAVPRAHCLCARWVLSRRRPQTRTTRLSLSRRSYSLWRYSELRRKECNSDAASPGSPGVLSVLVRIQLQTKQWSGPPGNSGAKAAVVPSRGSFSCWGDAHF